MTFTLIPEDLDNAQPANPFYTPAAKCLRRYFPNERIVTVHDTMIRIGGRFWETPQPIRKYMWQESEMPMEFELDLDQKDGSPGHEFDT